MKILVPVKRVIDHSVRVRIKADFSGVETANVKMAMNPFDEIALEAAIRLKEQAMAQEVILVSIGSKEWQETLRYGLALGADRALLLETTQLLSPLAIAKKLATVVKQEAVQLVLMGKQAIDDDCNQTGQMLAGLLNWPQATFASKLTLNGQSLDVVREINGGLESLRLHLPAVVTADLRLNKPRYISLPNIMQAKRKPLDVQMLDPTPDSSVKILKIESPPVRKSGRKLGSVAELVNVLKQEVKVL